MTHALLLSLLPEVAVARPYQLFFHPVNPPEATAYISALLFLEKDRNLQQDESYHHPETKAKGKGLW
jgi:hypothetical protein